jgi:hypothetical protein
MALVNKNGKTETLNREKTSFRQRVRQNGDHRGPDDEVAHQRRRGEGCLHGALPGRAAQDQVPIL